MPLPPAVVDSVLAQLDQDLPGLAGDHWAPSVQGAVGHVVGVRAADGSPLVLKIYPTDARGRLDTEVAALRLLGDLPGVPAPRPVRHGRVTALPGVAYLVMTRLDGVRWADRHDALTPAQHVDLIGQVARLMRRFHTVTGEWFGALTGDGPRWDGAWARGRDRADDELRSYWSAGGPPELARRVHAVVHDHRAAVASCRVPALCHNDVNGGNLLIDDTGAPRISAVVDLERASWDDPLTDLAKTRRHLSYHWPHDTQALTDAYGVNGADEHARLDVYELLHAVQERTWISHDRPAGWQSSIDALDAYLEAHT